MAEGESVRAFECEYKPGEELVLRFRRPIVDLIPAEAAEHLIAARKEFLLALRGLVDAAISRLEEKERARTQRRTEIKVE